MTDEESYCCAEVGDTSKLDALVAERDRLKREVEIAWAAGLFDGEGSFMVINNSRPNRYPKARASLAMTDKDSVERFARIVGVGAIGSTPDTRGGRVPCWQWTCNRIEDIRWLAKAFDPWLSERRREQARAAISGHVPRDDTYRARNLGRYALRKEQRDDGA